MSETNTTKTQSQKIVRINDKAYVINAFKGIKGWSYLPRLTKYVFPFISFMFDEGRGEAEVMDEMVKLLSGNNAEEVITLIQDLVADVQVDGSTIDFDFEFSQKYDALILLVIEVIKLNYFDSFQRLVTNLPKD
ncbi:tail assembly chaperone [Vibrio phage vB_VhaM_VH-8]|nr:tail assembly chaperone [Vibrio phage vB_VhaM_VH-8]